MADVRPFAGLRFDPSRVSLSRALCPPYDVIGEEEARRLRREAANAIHLELPEARGAAKYRGAARLWRRWRAQGLIRPDPAPSFYVCEERFRLGGRSLRRLGFLAAMGVGDEAARAVLPHERTLPKPKADRLRLLKAVRANISPIFGIFPDPSAVVRRVLSRAAAGRPAAQGVMASGVSYQLWRLAEPALVRGIRRALASRKVLIADGHHRYEVSRAYWKAGGAGDGADALLAYLCPEEDSGLVVLPTHRVVTEALVSPAESCCRWLRCASLRELLSRLAASPNPYAFGFIESGCRLGLPRSTDGCRSGLCVEWLGRRLLGRVPPEAIRYTPDAAAALAMARRLGGTAVLVKPFRVAQIRRAVKAVGLLPPKSTYFYPKIATGLVFKSL